MGSRLLFIDEQKTRRGKWRSGCEYVRGLRQMGGRGGRVSRHRNGGQGKGGWGCWGIALCQHVPKTAATQSCPAGCQACVSCVVSSPVLHHVHCVFGSFPIHRSRGGPALPAKLWLSSVSLIRRLPWPRVGASGAHWSGRVVRVS